MNKNITKVLITNFQDDIKFNGKETLQIGSNKMWTKIVFRSKTSSGNRKSLPFTKKFQNPATLIYRYILNKQWTADLLLFYLLLLNCFLSQVTCYLSPCYLSLVTCYLLLVTCYLLLATSYLLLITCY